MNKTNKKNKLNKEWEYRRKLWKEAAGFFLEAQKVSLEKYKKTRTENNDWITVKEYGELLTKEKELIEKANYLWEIATKFWLDAILEVHGNIKIRWKGYNKITAPAECYLENGEIYKFEE